MMKLHEYPELPENSKRIKYKERNNHYEKLNEMRIEKRLISSFRITTLITSVTAIAAILVLLIISNRYTYALQYLGFAQGDIGRR